MAAIRSTYHYLLAAAIAMPLNASVKQNVRVEREQGVYTVSAEVPVAVDASTAWRVLTDYNRLADFVPDMKVSHVVSAAGAPVLLEQRGNFGVLIFRTKIQVILRIDETPQERINFRAVSGNVKRMQGEWRVRQDGPILWLSYHAEIEPDTWAPPLIGRAVLRASVEKQIAGVVQEMRTRFAESRPAGAPTDQR